MKSAKTRHSLAAVASGLALLGDSTLYAVLPLQAAVLGLSGLQVGLILSINRASRFVLNEPAGLLIERRGPRAALVLALTLAALTTWITAYAGVAAFALLLGARCLWGLAWSLVRHTGNHLFLRAPRGQRGALQGSFRSTLRLGSLLAVLAGSWLVQAVGFADAYELLALGTLPGLLLAWWAFSAGAEPEPREAVEPARGATAQSPLDPAPPPGARSLESPEGGLLALTIAGTLTGGLGVSLLAATASFRLSEIVAQGARSTLFGVPVGVVMLGGMAGAGRWIAEIFVGPWAGRASDRISRRAVIVAGAAGSTGGLLACALARSTTELVVAALLAFAALITLQTGLDVLAVDRSLAGPRSGARLGRYTAFTDAGNAIGPLAGAWLMDVRGGIQLAYLLAAAVFLALVITFGRSLRRRRLASLAGTRAK